MFQTCNARIPLHPSGRAYTHCKRKEGHTGDHSTAYDDPEARAATYRVMPLLRPAAARTEPAGVSDLFGDEPPKTA